MLKIYTDGSSRGNPGPGGFGTVMIFGKHRKEISQGYKNTTNNRMELMAAIEGPKALKRSCTVILTTDSQYVRKGITEWLAGWKRKNWKTASRQPVKNQDLWQLLDEQSQRHEIDWRWIKGHAGHRENEIADQLACKGAESFRK